MHAHSLKIYLFFKIWEFCLPQYICAILFYFHYCVNTHPSTSYCCAALHNQPLVFTDLFGWYQGSQRDVVYLGWPIAPSHKSPNAGGGVVPGAQSQWVELCTYSKNLKNFVDLYISIFNLRLIHKSRLKGYSFLLQSRCGAICHISAYLLQSLWVWED